ncbi:MAG: sigma-70 family RNA polymerase sigma factor [Armatimonadota bacterium]|nr:sigma-70 family RNA polymerase sigma factor [Armatimonadota bacterium]
MERKENGNLSSTAANLTTERSGSREQLFERLLSQTHRQAFHIALRLSGNRSDAEDLVQETFVRAFRFFHRYDETLPFSSWLYRIMMNAHIDEVRRRGKLRASSLDEPHPETGTTWDVPDDSSSPERLMLSDEMEAEVQDGLMNMTADFRMAVLLADLEGLSYEEIAQVMATSIGTVRSRIHRGRKQLRNYLVKSCPEKYADLLIS